MIRDASLMQVVMSICERDTRYQPDAYLFVLDALEFTTKILQKGGKAGKERHVGGRELLEGLRQFAVQDFGPMALRVLHSWGLTRTEDFGEIVFNLVASGKLRKTEEDSRADFAAGYDFREAFALPFLPASTPDATRRGPRSSRGAADTGKRKSGPDDPPPAKG
jgi:uncharacterized repeat protein (TIGR04138 family)